MIMLIKRTHHKNKNNNNNLHYQHIANVQQHVQRLVRDLMALMTKDEEGKSAPTSYGSLASNKNNNLNYALPSSSSNTTATSSSGNNAATTNANATAIASIPVNA